MKSIRLLLPPALAVLLGALPTALPVPPVQRPEVPPQARLEALVGEYLVEARLWHAPGAEPITASGEATWELTHGGAYLHERFTLDVQGRELKGDAWMRWSEAAQRFELTQIDEFHPSTLWLTGAWDPEHARISLHDVAATRAEGARPMRWDYAFEGFGGFVKRILHPAEEGEGGWSLASEYRYVPVDNPVRGPALTRVGGVARVPMAEGFQWPVIEVMLNGQGPFRMVFDTGASTTVLNEDLVRELQLMSEGTSRIGDPSDPLANEVDVLTLDVVELGGARFEGVAAVGWRGDPLVGMGGIRGVLGLPTFADCLVTLDYPARAVEVRAGELPEPDGREVLPMTVDGIVSFPIEVAGVAFEAHLDAGNASSLVLPGDWIEKMPLVEGSLRTGRGMRASGPVEFTVATLEGSVKLGSHDFARPEVRFDAQLPDANVGYTLLKDLAVTLDQRNGRLRLSVPGDPVAGSSEAVSRRVEAPPGDRRQLGVQLRGTTGGATTVAAVVAGSAAEAAGIQAGDLLLEVNGEAMSHEVLMAALRGGDPLKLKLERGGKPVAIVLFE